MKNLINIILKLNPIEIESFRHEFHGNSCIKRGYFEKIKGVNWNEKFGPQDKSYDIECIEKLFSLNKKYNLFWRICYGQY